MPAKKPTSKKPASKPSRAAAKAKTKPKAPAKAAKAPRPAGKRPKESPKALRTRTAAIIDQLAKDYGDAECALHHKNAFQLLVATILSAQCTDERVNMVTPALFKKYPTPAAFVAA